MLFIIIYHITIIIFLPFMIIILLIFLIHILVFSFHNQLIDMIIIIKIKLLILIIFIRNPFVIQNIKNYFILGMIILMMIYLILHQIDFINFIKNDEPLNSE